jgi:hypothetical protein
MRAKEFIPVSKPRNFVAKNQQTAGAGAHKDKKRAEKQGDVKHKKQAVPMEGVAEGYKEERLKGCKCQHRQGDNKKCPIHGVQEGVAEVSQQTLQSYRKKAAKEKNDAMDIVNRDDVDDATWAKNVNKASQRKDGIAAANKRLGVAEVSKATIDRYVSKASDAHGDADFKARMSKHDPDKRSYHVDQKKTAEKRRQGISRALDRMSRDESVGEATSVAVRMQRAADKQRAKSDASLARTPSSIPKKEEPKK